MKRITSRENDNIKQVLKLRKKKYQDRDNMFFIEGKKMLGEALRCRELLVKIFIEESVAEEYLHFKNTLPGVEKNILDSRLMNTICDTETPQGIAAIVKKPVWSIENIIDQKAFFILLDQISDPGNMGTIIRTSWGLGVDGILLTGGCVDPFNPKVIRATMGGVFNLPLFVNSLDEHIKLLKKNNYSFMGASLETEISVYSMDFKGPLVVVIGSESSGISEEIQGVCEKFFKIPLNPGVDSLNAAVACAIITSEINKQRRSFSLF